MNSTFLAAFTNFHYAFSSCLISTWFHFTYTLVSYLSIFCLSKWVKYTEAFILFLVFYSNSFEILELNEWSGNVILTTVRDSCPLSTCFLSVVAYGSIHKLRDLWSVHFVTHYFITSMLSKRPYFTFSQENGDPHHPALCMKM